MLFGLSLVLVAGFVRKNLPRKWVGSNIIIENLSKSPN
jgi:hypothetical protein